MRSWTAETVPLWSRPGSADLHGGLVIRGKRTSPGSLRHRIICDTPGLHPLLRGLRRHGRCHDAVTGARDGLPSRYTFPTEGAAEGRSFTSLIRDRRCVDRRHPDEGEQADHCDARPAPPQHRGEFERAHGPASACRRIPVTSANAGQLGSRLRGWQTPASPETDPAL